MSGGIVPETRLAGMGGECQGRVSDYYNAASPYLSLSLSLSPELPLVGVIWGAH